MKRIISLIMVLFLVLSFGVTTHAEEKDTIVAGVSGEPKTLNCVLSSDRNTEQVTTSIYDTLTDMDDVDDEIKQGLAESWELNDKKDQVVFKIREGVKFHNGDILTPEDVAFSYNLCIKKGSTKLLTGMMDRMEVTGKNEVTLYLKHTFEPILRILATPRLGIINKKAYEADPDGFARNPVGTGPFKFVSWESGDRVTLERFDDYYKGPAAYKHLIIRIMVDLNTAAIALENGEIDIMPGLQASDIVNLEKNKDLAVYEKTSANFHMIILNNNEGLFADKEARLAVAYAINRQEIIDGVLEGKADPLYVFMAHGVFGYPKDFEPMEYDIEKAREHLAKSSYKGEELLFKTTQSAERVKVSELICAQLADAGFNIKVDQMEGGRFFDEVYAHMKYEIGLFNTTSDYGDADAPGFARLHSSMFGNSNNYFGVKNEELDKVLEEGRFSADPEVREKAYEKMSEIIRDEAITVPLFAGLNNVVANKNIKGVKANSVLKIYYGKLSWGE